MRAKSGLVKVTRQVANLTIRVIKPPIWPLTTNHNTKATEILILIETYSTCNYYAYCKEVFFLILFKNSKFVLPIVPTNPA